MDPYNFVERLQNAGIPSGVCQTAEDRCDRYLQLRALKWMTKVTGTKIDKRSVAEAPFKLSRTSAYIGGLVNRGAPCYGEDNQYVLGELLGYSLTEIRKFTDDVVI